MSNDSIGSMSTGDPPTALLQSLLQSWSSAHPIKHRIPPVDKISHFLGKNKIQQRVLSRLICILLARPISPAVIEALPILITLAEEPQIDDLSTPAAAATWSLAVITTSISASTLKCRLPSFSNPFDNIIASLKLLILPSTSLQEAPSLATPLELLATGYHVVPSRSTGTTILEYRPLNHCTHYEYHGGPSLLINSLCDLGLRELEKPKKPSVPSHASSYASRIPITSIPVQPTIHRRKTHTPSYPLKALGRKASKSSGPELSRRRAYTNKANHASVNGPKPFLSSLGSANEPSRCFANPFLKNSVGRKSRPSVDAHPQQTSPADVIVLDADDDTGEDDVEVVDLSTGKTDSVGTSIAPASKMDTKNMISHQETMGTINRHSVNISDLWMTQRAKRVNFSQGPVAPEKKRELVIENTAGKLSIPLQPDTCGAYEQDRQRRTDGRLRKRKAEGDEYWKKLEAQGRGDQNLESLRRINHVSNSNYQSHSNDSRIQYESGSKMARKQPIYENRQNGLEEGCGNCPLTIDLIGNGGGEKQEVQLVSPVEEYERKRRELMDRLAGHMNNVSGYDITTIEMFLKGQDVFGQKESVDILLHHNCSRSGNDHYLRLTKEPRRVEEVFRADVF